MGKPATVMPMLTSTLVLIVLTAAGLAAATSNGSPHLVDAIIPESAQVQVLANPWEAPADCQCATKDFVLKDQHVVTVVVDEHNQADWGPALKRDVPAETLVKVQVYFSNVRKDLEEKGIEIERLRQTQDNVLASMGVWGKEVRELAVILDAPLLDVLTFNVIYNIAGGCTSTVANTADGKIVHGRNLDYGGFERDSDISSFNTVIHTKFTDKSGVLLYECPGFIGFVGCLTGVRKGKLSVSLNQRYPVGQGGKAAKANWEMAFPEGKEYSGALAPGLWIRKHLGKGSSYAAAVASIKSTNFVTPAYITMGGVATGEGSVTYVERENTQTVVHHIGENAFPCYTSFCLITNNDKWEDLNTNNETPGEEDRYACGFQHVNSIFITQNNMFHDAMSQCASFIPVDKNKPDGLAFGTISVNTMSAGAENPIEFSKYQEVILHPRA